jgi:uncharacterized protein involved in exopolysaccharide biosynthesis
MSDEQNNLNNVQEEELSAKESFKLFIEKLSPYFQKAWGSKKKLFVINGTILVVSVAFLLLFVKPYFDTTVTILPDYGTQSTALAQFGGLASLAGVNIGQGSSTAIYQQLVTSESVLKPVIYKKYKTEEYPDSVNLIKYFDVEPDESLPKSQQQRGMFLSVYTDFVKSRLKTNLDAVTNVLTITVRMPEGELSADVINSIAKSLDRYIRTQLKYNAKEQLIYIQKRIGQVQDSLRLAENGLTEFQIKNKATNQSPQLQLEESRLQRNVTILNTVYLQLQQQLELAKIDAIKDAPVLNIMESVKDPIIKTGPSRSIMLILIMFFAVCLTVLYYATKDELKNYWGMIKGMVRKR